MPGTIDGEISGQDWEGECSMRFGGLDPETQNNEHGRPFYKKLIRTVRMVSLLAPELSSPLVRSPAPRLWGHEMGLRKL